MTPPNVIFVPSAGAAATYSMSGDLVYDSPVRFRTTNETESGVVADFDPYGSASIRNLTTSIMFYIRITGWTNVDDFLASGGFTNVEFLVNGSSFGYSSITHNSGTGTLLSIYMNAPSATVSSFWSSMAGGDPFTLNLYY